ncbi:hypothetical protein TRFO_35826 [Tritrichomonas foetus]|uniref:Uncharacterized protein n=1 Tax=Tritrichomonas foetus TaxID=1144522 RepID=A0A1J4JFG8_9EUKA|nr:hypothetical protein TRFO_35826 [Tritrichomonas foetus]|eukprot:OHS97890.1 hypothetical protein TRFO_35826 [Tritrichomonas foetus]
MSGDFVFVDFDEDLETPIIEGVSLSRLQKEWDAVKIDLQSPIYGYPLSNPIWCNLLTIYQKLLSQNKKEADEFQFHCLSEIRFMLKDQKYKKGQGSIFSFFIDFVSTLNCTFLDIDGEIIESILKSLNSAYKLLNPQLLLIFLDPYCADEIQDVHGDFPFLQFLIKAYPNNDEISLIARKVILIILKKKRYSAENLIPLLFDSFVDLFCFFSKISPTIYEKSAPFELFKFINTSLCYVNQGTPKSFESIDNYCYNVSHELLDNLKNEPATIQFRTFLLFLTQLHHNPTISVFIHYMLKENGIFGKNIENWVKTWTLDSLKMISAMIDLRSTALQTAFFYSENLNRNASIFGFPDPPSEFILKQERKNFSTIEDFSIYQQQNNELPMPLDHVKSLFEIILTLFSMFWTLPLETDELLMKIIKCIAGSKTDGGMTFCYTPGTGIYAQTQVLLEEMMNYNSDKERRALLGNFVLSMHRIFRAFKC